jgi:hypothetical protein
VLSLVGNQLTIVTAAPEALRGGSPITKEVVLIKDRALDGAALMAADAAVRKSLPSATVVMLRASDARLFAMQSKWESDSSIDVAELVNLLGTSVGNSAQSHLIVICSHRSPISLRLQEGSTGSGAVAGLGLYVNTWEVTERVDTKEQGVGFLAPFANFRMVLIDLHTMAVEAQEYSATGVVVSAAFAHDGKPWHALSDQGKVDRLRSLLATEIERLTPRLLDSSRR